MSTWKIQYNDFLVVINYQAAHCSFDVAKKGAKILREEKKKKKTKSLFLNEIISITNISL